MILRPFCLLVALAGAGCLPALVSSTPAALPLAYAPVVVSSYVASAALARAEEAETEVREERDAREHAEMLRRTWGIETTMAAAPLEVKSADDGTGHELGTWDH
jgi:hypothetical protein